MLVSVLSLMAVSYDRFVTISFPFRPRMTTKTATIIIVAIWVLSLSIAAPIITSRSYNVIN